MEFLSKFSNQGGWNKNLKKLISGGLGGRLLSTKEYALKSTIKNRLN